MSSSVDDPLSLAQLLCTRLCHDLAGPIGAVAAGVELTAGDPTQIDSETLSLIGNSSAAASRKLKFLRAALGMPGAPTAMLGELPNLMEGYLSATAGRGGPPTLEWPPSSDTAEAARVLGANAVPILLNVALLALEAQPSCRRLKVQVTAQPKLAIVASAEGERAAEWRPEIAAAFTTSPESPTAKTVQAYLLATLTRHAGGKVLLESRAQTAQAAFQIP